MSWKAAYFGLTAAFLLTAALNLLHVRGGFLTNHLADLVVPAWLYLAARGLGVARATTIPRWLFTTPERAAAVLFTASAATELSQKLWPGGPFSGRYDPLDLVAYGLGLLACYASEKRWGRDPDCGVGGQTQSSPAGH